MTLLNLESALIPVTGAASGIGLAICQRLREAGARPLLLDIDQARLRQAVTAVYGADEADRHGYVLDVRDAAAVDACLARIAADHGPITHAVANAGRAQGANVLDLTDEQWHGLMDINLHGTLYFCRASARQLARRGSGAIVAMASIAGLRAKESRAAYSASKAAVLGMTRALALDLGPLGVRVNAVAPGIIDTPLQTNPAFADPINERAALRRVGSADEIAKATLFLLSDMASYVTGTTLVVDGGLTVRYV